MVGFHIHEENLMAKEVNVKRHRRRPTRRRNGRKVKGSTVKRYLRKVKKSVAEERKESKIEKKRAEALFKRYKTEEQRQQTELQKWKAKEAKGKYVADLKRIEIEDREARLRRLKSLKELHGVSANIQSRQIATLKVINNELSKDIKLPEGKLLKKGWGWLKEKR